MTCLACDQSIPGEPYTHLTWHPLCQKCSLELEAMADWRADKEARTVDCARRRETGEVRGVFAQIREFFRCW